MDRTSPIYTPQGGPPQVARPSSEILDAIGEEGVFAIIAELYQRLERSSVRHLFPKDMLLASKKSAAFFVQLLGGRPLFSQVYGPPRMRQRHLPFEIDEEARVVWRKCFDDVIEEAEQKAGFPVDHMPGFRAFLDAFSLWMVNKSNDQTS